MADTAVVRLLLLAVAVTPLGVWLKVQLDEASVAPS